MIGIPLVFVLQDLSPTGKFIGSSLFIFVLPTSTIGLVFGPKIRRVHWKRDTSKTRGARANGPVVTGLDTHPQPSNAAAAAEPEKPNSGQQAFGQSSEHPPLPDQVQTVDIH